MDDTSLDRLRYLIDELRGREFWYHQLANTEIIEIEIIRILRELATMAGTHDELRHLQWDIDKSINDFNHIEILLERLEEFEE